ncbi:MAG: VWA domain-containing protein [Candidatus Poribacteria bacterium]|nr:VWA domain-containing protein [Candidatus Poribacteria bacterium]
MLSLILLAMCGFSLRLRTQAGTVVVVADRSRSMPLDSESRHREAINLIQTFQGSDSNLAVVSFGRTPAIEQPPQSGKFAGFVGDVHDDASDLNGAIETALALIPQGSPGRILLLSDALWTGKNPSAAAAQAAARGIAIDHRLIRRDSTSDIAITQVDAPNAAAPGESFMLSAWIHSPIRDEVSFEFSRGNHRLASGRRTVASGLSRLVFRDKATQAGTHQYTVRIKGTETDPVPENNTAKVLVGIHGPRPVLHVTTSPNSSFARVLQEGGLDVETALPTENGWSLDALSGYSAVLVENVPADKIGLYGMENLAVWVKETGAGFMMTGGEQAFGQGGYFKSPLEPIMPVSMELRREHRKLSLAIVVAMDRSGSMSMPVSGGRTKMRLANLATAEVLDMLSPMDEFGVIAVDSSPHIIADLSSVENSAQVRSRILRIDTGGGGIFVYEALFAASNMLLNAEAGTRHIILFADAADSEEPGKYKELLEKCRSANITVSVVGLGTATDVDAELLRDIARRGEGRCLFTQNAEELPRLFAQDTFVVARSTFVEEPVEIRTTGGMVTLTGNQYQIPYPIGGYNLCYIRPDANLAAVTEDEYKAPVVAAWQAEIGRVLCFTGEVDGDYTGAIAGWNGVGDFLTSLVRWTAGDSGDMPREMLLTQEVKNGINVVELHLDPERQGDPFREPPRATLLRGIVGQKPTVEEFNLSWASADTLAVDIPIHGSETVLATVEVPGAGNFSLPPVCLPYSPEFRPATAESGRETMERLAHATGGKTRINFGAIWNDLPREPRLLELKPWLLIAALILLLVEILERRTGLISMRHGRKKTEPKAARTFREDRTVDQFAAASPSPAEQGDPDEPDGRQTPPEREKMLDALNRARKRASGRTRSER